MSVGDPAAKRRLPFGSVVMVDGITEFAREGALSELLYADDLVLMSGTIEGLRNKFMKWKEAFESKGLKVNLGKTNIMVSRIIIDDGMSKSKVDLFGVYRGNYNVFKIFCMHKM